MQWFPSVWDLLIPRINGVAMFGWIILLIIFLDSVFLRGIIITSLSKMFRVDDGVFNTALIFGSIVAIWGSNIIIQTVTSPGFIIGFFSIFVILLVGFLLFWDDIKRLRNK